MANLSSIARPYALAAFEYAREHKQLPTWQSYLNMAASVLEDPATKIFMKNSAVGSEILYDLLQEVLAPYQSEDQQRFLALITLNNRIYLLPAIAASFNLLFDAEKKLSHVKLITAINVDDDYKNMLAKALAKRMQRDVTLDCEIDPSIIGGAILQMGDRVIDGSVRGKLTRLLEFSLR